MTAKLQGRTMSKRPMTIEYAEKVLRAGLKNKTLDSVHLKALLAQCKADPVFVGDFRHVFCYTPKQLFQYIRLAIRRADYRYKKRNR